MNPDSRTPPTAEEPPLEAELPGWIPPSQPTLDQLDPARTTVTETPPAIPEAPSFLENEDGDRDAEQPGPTSPRPERTSRRSVGNPGDPTVASAAAGLFGLVASVLSLVLNATIGHGSGAYLMREGEAAAIGEPLGRIASRHAPVGDGDVDDIGDGIQAGVAAAAYAARATIEHFGAPAGPPAAEATP